MSYDELANYSEANFETMVEGLKAQDQQQNIQQSLARDFRWWVKFCLCVMGIVFTAFWCGYFMSAVTR